MPTLLTKYPLDLTGRSPNNLVIGEPHTLDNNGRGELRVFVPNYGAFYTEDLVVRDANGATLAPNVDYIATYLYEEPTTRSGLEVCGAIVVTNPNVSATVYADYQVVGGDYAISTNALEQVLQTLNDAEQPVEWGAIIGKPSVYPPGGHLHALWELYGFEYIVIQLERLQQAILAGDQAMHESVRAYAKRLVEDAEATTANVETQLSDHKAATNNPHGVTKTQIGLGQVDNYPTATDAQGQTGTSATTFMTPKATKAAITTQAVTPLNTHKGDTTNPHNVTKTQVGLGNVENYPVATQTEAENGVSSTRYMTPLRTQEAINAVAITALDSHRGDTNNPHNVTKTQVGLGSVANYPIANQGEAEAGSVNTRYMTPLRTKQAINDQALSVITTHTNDTTNPHNVTKAQVGLGQVANHPVATEAEARALASNARYLTPATLNSVLVDHAGSDAHDARYIRRDVAMEGALRVFGTNFQVYMDGGWRTVLSTG